MLVRVLGPLLVGRPDAPVEVPARKTRQVITLLALEAPGSWSTDQLTGALWDDPPPSAVKTVQSLVSRARSVLTAATATPSAITGGPSGYALALPPDDVDVLMLDTLRQRARVAAGAGDHAAAAFALGRARQLWRGDPELPETVAGRAEATRLQELRLRLIEDHLDALIATGRHGEAVVELESLTAAEPLRERLWELRMLALYRSGRQADALRAFQAVRERLADDVGVEPGPDLRRLEAAILDHDGHLDLPPSPPPVDTVAASAADDFLHYATTDGVHVAYRIFGDGPTDLLLLIPGFISVDTYLDEPRLAGAVRRLATGRRVIALDRRGVGRSDPVSTDRLPTIDDWTRDVIAVLDAAGSSCPDVLANADTGLVALQLAARHPDRVRSLVLVNGFARFMTAPDYPYGWDPDTIASLGRDVLSPNVRGLDLLTIIAPGVAGDDEFRAWWDRAGRRAASPGTAQLLRGVVSRGGRASRPAGGHRAGAADHQGGRFLLQRRPRPPPGGPSDQRQGRLLQRPERPVVDR